MFNLIKRLLCICCIIAILPFAPTSAQAQENGKRFIHLGIDENTRGSWEGKYGADGYVLIGYEYAAKYGMETLKNIWESKSPYLGTESDLIRYGAFEKYSAENINNVRSAPNEVTKVERNLLAMPKSMGGNPYTALTAFSNKNALNEYCGRFRFVMKDDSPRVFSIYSHEGSNVGEGPTDMVNEKTTIRFYNEKNSLVFEKTFEKKPFSGARYASFLVQGTFTVEIVLPGKCKGPSGFFFDTFEKIDSNQIKSEFNEKEGGASIKLKNAKSEMSLSLFRQSEGFNTENLNIAPQSLGEFFDASISSGTVYKYSLVGFENGKYSISDDIEIQTPKLPDIKLTANLKKIEGVTGKKSEFRLRLQMKNGTALAGKTISVTRAGKYIGDIFEKNIGEFITDSKGYALVEFTPEFSGSYTITASFAADFKEEYSDAKIQIPVTICDEEYNNVPYLLKISDAVKYDELISISGEGIGGKRKNIEIKAEIFSGYDNLPEQPGKKAVSLEIVQLDEAGHFVTAKMPQDTPAGLYAIWVKNDFGWSKPIILNEARPLFISEYEAWAGLTIDVSGRNFSAKQFGMPDDYTALRLTDAAGNSYVQQLNKITPYSLNFTIGEDVPLGEYRVEITNNGGISWIEVSSKQTLSIEAVGKDPLGLGVAWANDYNWDNIVNVADFGADGKRNADDTADVMRAVEFCAQSGGGVVFIPEGTYRISHIDLQNGVVLMGAGADKTKIYYTGKNNSTFVTSVDTNENPAQLQGIANMLITVEDEAEYYKNNPSTVQLFWFGHQWGSKVANKDLRTANRFFQYGVKTRFPFDPNIKSGGGTLIIADERFLVKDCDFCGYAGNQATVAMNEYIYLKDSKWKYIKGYVQAYAAYAFVFDCEINGYSGPIDYYHDKVVDGMYNLSHGFFYKENSHIEGCRVISLTGDADSEAYCAEQATGTYNYGNIITAGKDYVVVDPNVALTEEFPERVGNATVMIIDGRGLGQRRRMKYIKGNTIYLEEEWDVIPDGSSKFTFNSFIENYTVYNCYNEDTGATVRVYCGAYDAVIANHKAVNGGAIDIQANINNSGRGNAVYFVTFRDCINDGCNWRTGDKEQGYDISTTKNTMNGDFIGSAVYGVEFRNCSASGVKKQLAGRAEKGEEYEYGVSAGGGLSILSDVKFVQQTDRVGEIANVIVENCKFSGFRDAFKLGINNYGLVFRNNDTNGNDNLLYTFSNEYAADFSKQILFTGGQSRANGLSLMYDMSKVNLLKVSEDTSKGGSK